MMDWSFPSQQLRSLEENQKLEVLQDFQMSLSPISNVEDSFRISSVDSDQFQLECNQQNLHRNGCKNERNSIQGDNNLISTVLSDSSDNYSSGIGSGGSSPPSSPVLPSSLLMFATTGSSSDYRLGEEFNHFFTSSILSLNLNQGQSNTGVISEESSMTSLPLSPMPPAESNSSLIKTCTEISSSVGGNVGDSNNNNSNNNNDGDNNNCSVVSKRSNNSFHTVLRDNHKSESKKEQNQELDGEDSDDSDYEGECIDDSDSQRKEHQKNGYNRNAGVPMMGTVKIKQEPISPSNLRNQPDSSSVFYSIGGDSLPNKTTTYNYNSTWKTKRQLRKPEMKISRKERKLLEEETSNRSQEKIIMESFGESELTDFKHVVYNLLVANHNYGETLAMPCILLDQVTGRFRTGFRFDENRGPDKRLPELYAQYVRKAQLDQEDPSNVLIQDVYKYYLRACVELLGKYFDKRDKFTYLYDEVPLFVPNGSLADAEKRIRSMKTRARRRKQHSF